MSVHVLDDAPTTDEAFGTFPDDRTLEQRLASGFILVDKPAGPTSHQLAAWARDLLGLERLGHGGTLDPFATGVLPLMAGRCMKITNKILKHKKCYVAVFRFRQAPDEEALRQTMAKLTGRIYNVPPKFPQSRFRFAREPFMNLSCSMLTATMLSLESRVKQAPTSGRWPGTWDCCSMHPSL